MFFEKRWTNFLQFCNTPFRKLQCQVGKNLCPVHKSHFCHVKFNSIKCGRNVTVDSEVPLVSHLIHNRYCRVCWSAENVLNTEYSIWRINILSDKGLKFGQNLSANGTRRRLTMQHVLQYVKVELRQKWCIQIYAWSIHKHNLWIRLNTPDIWRLNRCCILMRQGQSKEQQKCSSRFRHWILSHLICWIEFDTAEMQH